MPRGRRLSPEEQRLWRHVTKDVARPERRPTPPPPVPEAPADNSPKTSTQTRNTRKYHHVPLPLPTVPPPPEALRHGTAPGLDRRTARRMKRGKLDIDDTLDLHGHTQTQAHRALLRFLEGAHRSHLKSVLVITGKGNRAEGGAGVLQESVPRWLNENPAHQWVNAFSYANIRDGGTGALYILMKRPKPPRGA